MQVEVCFQHIRDGTFYQSNPCRYQFVLSRPLRRELVRPTDLHPNDRICEGHKTPGFGVLMGHVRSNSSTSDFT